MYIEIPDTTLSNHVISYLDPMMAFRVKIVSGQI